MEEAGGEKQRRNEWGGKRERFRDYSHMRWGTSSPEDMKVWNIRVDVSGGKATGWNFCLKKNNNKAHLTTDLTAGRRYRNPDTRFRSLMSTRVRKNLPERHTEERFKGTEWKLGSWCLSDWQVRKRERERESTQSWWLVHNCKSLYPLDFLGKKCEALFSSFFCFKWIRIDLLRRTRGVALLFERCSYVMTIMRERRYVLRVHKLLHWLASL